MVEGTADERDELRTRVARMEGEFAVTREQVISLEATETQLRVELEAAKVEAATAQSELAHVQKLADERVDGLRTRVNDLTQQLDDARQSRQQAEQERAAIVAALGRRARKRLEIED